jgi:hypothetical protein
MVVIEDDVIGDKAPDDSGEEFTGNGDDHQDGGQCDPVPPRAKQADEAEEDAISGGKRGLHAGILERRSPSLPAARFDDPAYPLKQVRPRGD